MTNGYDPDQFDGSNLESGDDIEQPETIRIEPDDASIEASQTTIVTDDASLEQTQVIAQTDEGAFEYTETTVASGGFSSNLASYWNESPTWRKILTVVVVAAVVALLVLGCSALANLFLGSSTEPGATATPPSVIVPTPAPGVPSLTASTNVTIHGGPGVEYPVIGILGAGESAEVVGISADGMWWAIKLPDTSNEFGWVANEFVVTRNTDNVPVMVAPPLPTPTRAPPVEITGWLGEYYNNPNLQGDPVVTRDDAEINFNWGTQPPASGMPAENWSARWTTTRDNIAAGVYRISVWVDDGVRVWVDDNLVIDGWQADRARNYTADVNVVAGTHTVRVEYFQSTGSSLIQLTIGYIDEYADWKGEYFNNPNVEGEPEFIRNDSDIDFNWNTGSPAPGVQADNYSVRWSRAAFFEQGAYRFSIDLEGGARMWLDGVLLIDDWVNAGPRTLTADSSVNRDYHDLRLDYFKSTGNGRVRFAIQKLDASTTTPTALPPTPAPGAPTAIISAPPPPNDALVGDIVQFIGDQSVAAPGSNVVTFEWNFGDGSGSNDANPTHVYPAAGIYQITLTVIDNNGLASSAASQIRINQATTPPPTQGPTASISAPDAALVGETIVFDGSSSFGPNPISDYRWDFGDGSTANAVVVNQIYNRAGLYNVTLTVTDNQGLSNAITVRISISEAAATATPPAQGPTASIGAPLEGALGVPITFDASESLGVIVSYEWDFGDGEIANAERVEHVYNRVGLFTVVLTVTDDQGLSDTTNNQINIVDAAPAPTSTTETTATPEGPGLAGEPWTLTGTLPGTVLDAEFSNDGKVAGTGGCNTYTASYTTNGSNITISALTSGNVSCGTEIDQQEAAYFTNLQGATSYTIQNLQLTLSGGVQPLVYSR